MFQSFVQNASKLYNSLPRPKVCDAGDEIKPI